MRIKFQTPVSPIADKSSASTEFKDTDINSVYLFLVNQGTGRVYSVEKGENIQDSGEENKKTVEVVLTFGTDAPADTRYYCYVVTNIELSDEQMSSYKGYSYAELSNVLKLDDYQKTPINKGVSMWGMTPENEAFTKEMASKTVYIKLLRSLARVDVGLGKYTSGAWDGKKGDNLIPFRLKSIHILRANSGYLYIPKEAERDAISTGLNTDAKAYTPEVTTPSNVGTNLIVSDFRHYYENTNAHDTELSASVKDVTKIYIPESDVILGGTSLDAKHEERCAIIIGGFYDDATAESYYRVDFKQSTGGELTNILRNHQYILSITEVLGSGYKTPQEAYAGRSMNMNVEVLEWTSNDQDIIFDGVNWFSIEKKQVVVGGELGSSTTLAVSSTVPSANWAFAWGTTDVYPTDEKEYKQVDKLEIAGLVQVEKPNPPLTKPDQEGCTLSFTNLGGETKQKRYLFIKVNNSMRFRLAVNILPDGYTIEDWEKSPDYEVNL
jgi:hypothetical protein